MTIAPHGGKLTPRRVDAVTAKQLLDKYAAAPSLEVDEVILADLEMFSTGAMAPLEGFVTSGEYQTIVHECRLHSGLVWSLPITLPVAKDIAETAGKIGALKLTSNGTPIALVEASDVYDIDPKVEAEQVYRTTETDHPGVARLYGWPTTRVGGKVYVFDLPELPFAHYRLTPEQTRAEFEKRGWRTSVAFQTRNPIHRAHEYITKVALEIVDGLLIHPLVGATKSDDVPADVRIKCYEVMIEKYYNPQHVMMSVYPAAMRYGGPREAIFHALTRKNYGCTHMIVGRDHAGVGNYYGTYDAQLFFDQFKPEEIGIVPIKVEHSFWCKVTNQMATSKTSPSTPEQRLLLSGTKVREMLSRGELPPEEFSRPEVAQLLIEAYK